MRNVFVFFDGTSCTLATKTNIEEIYSLAKSASYPCRYHEGIGGFSRTKIRDFALAPDVEPRAVQAFQVLVDMDLDPEDRLYIFGYSRGAVIARTLAMCLVSKQHLISAAKVSGFAHTVRAQIEFLCLFDPVVGWPRLFKTRVPNHDAILEPRIKNYLELLSVDESRLFFPSDSYSASKKTNRKIELSSSLSKAATREGRQQSAWALALRKTRKTVWFPGKHGDVGGQSANPAIGLHALTTSLEELLEISETSGAGISFPTEKIQVIKDKLAQLDRLSPSPPAGRMQIMVEKIKRRWGRRMPPQNKFAQHLAHPLCCDLSPTFYDQASLPDYPPYTRL
jgi:hypothetical protein